MSHNYTEFPLLSLIPYPNNPRDNDKAVPYLVESIKKFGYIQPIVVDEHLVILAGHTRYKALLHIYNETGEFSNVEVLVISNLSEEEKSAYRIADNKVAEKADWAIPELSYEIMPIKDDFDWVKLGFSKKELNLLVEEAPLIVEDVKPSLPVEIRVGDNSFKVHRADFEKWESENSHELLGGKSLFEYLQDDLQLFKLKRRFELVGNK